MNIEDCKRHEAAMLRALYSVGLPEGERADVWVLGKDLADQGDEARLQAWACESLLYAVREVAMGGRCDWRTVVRCYGQAKAYVGRTNGRALTAYVNDAVSFVQRALEDRVSSVVAQPVAA